MKAGTRFSLIATVLAACSLGVYAMVSIGLPVSIWGQNVLAVVVLLLIAAFAPKLKVSMRYEVLSVVLVVLLAATLLFDGDDGIRRWVRVSVLSLNAAMIALPVVIWCLIRLFELGKSLQASLLTVLTASILLIQPDASQLTGFSFAIGVYLAASGNVRGALRLSICGFLLVATLFSWLFLSNLPPVVYVEEILSVLGGIHPSLLALGLILLFSMPLPLILCSDRKGGGVGVFVALYYWGISLSALAYDFPVPMIGYGVSPFIGYILLLLVFFGEAEGLRRPA